jgi:5-methylcytosine-specific restriction endonuclease McrA
MSKTRAFPDRQVATHRANQSKRSYLRRAQQSLVRYDIGNVPAEDLLLKLELQSYRCPYCGAPITFNICHLDHVFPVSKGGEHYLYNIALVCSTCNLLKRGRTLRRFCRKYGYDYESILQKLAEINYRLHILVFGSLDEDSPDS